MPLNMFKEKMQPLPPKIKRVVAIAAGKGGVGKSTVAVNLARALKRSGFAVGLMDTDIYGPSVRKMMPEERMPGQRGEMIVPAVCEGIPMISMAYFRDDSQAAVVRAPIANGIVNQFLTQVVWGDLDYLLIDFPPGTGDVQLTLSQKGNITGALMVTTPQEVAVLDVRKAMNMFDQVKVPILGIVENMSGYFHEATKETLYLFGKGGGERLAKETGVPFLGTIPIDPELSKRGDEGISIFSNDREKKECVSAKAFLDLAASVHDHLDALGSSEMVKRLEQNGPYTFVIEWNDGVVKEYRLSELQKLCPCAQCVDENTGKRLVNGREVDPDVRARGISSVGRYALKVDFTSGCSTGIYSYDMLRDL